MPKCFVFAIGGSGARIMESYTYMAAAGCALDSLSGWEIEPILIDLDTNNGNTRRCIKALQLYETLYGYLGNTTGKSPYFRMPFKRDIGTGRDFMLQLHADDTDTLAKSIRVTSLDREDQDLINLLYSKETLEMTLSEGFKGVPSIGNILLNQFAGNEKFQKFVQLFKDGDRIVVIGSIFGGTGAAGLPVLLKTLREQNNAIRTAPIASLCVLPYYQVATKKSAQIKSNGFITRTKSALSYYADNLKEANSTYYIGYNSSNTFAYSEGGEHQNNPPQAIEVLGATAIFDFLSKNNQAFTSYDDQAYSDSRQFFVCGFPNNNGTIDLSMLSGKEDNLRKWLKKPLSGFYYFYLKGYFIEQAIARGEKIIRIHSIKFPPGFQGKDFIKKLFEFQELFMEWLHKMNDTNANPRFIPFETVSHRDEVKNRFEEMKLLPYLIKNIPIPPKRWPNRLPKSIRDSLGYFTGNEIVEGIAADSEHLFSEASYLCVKNFMDSWKHLDDKESTNGADHSNAH